MAPASTLASQNVYRQRVDFARIATAIEIPNLIEVQGKSYEYFLQRATPPAEREERGLEAVFRNIFPIEDFNGTARLDYEGYEIGAWECRCGEYKGLGGPGVACEVCGDHTYSRVKYDVDECRQRGMTYATPLRVMVRLNIFERDERGGRPTISEVREQKVYLGEIPLMTDKGTFIINGTERVIVSQMHRSPGAFFDHDEGKVHPSGKVLYSARVIPYRGSWLDFEFDAKDTLFVRIDRRRKLPVTVLLKALGMSKEEILRTFYEELEVAIEDGKSYVVAVSDHLNGKKAAEDVVDQESGEVLVRAGRKFTRANIKRLTTARIAEVRLEADELLGQAVAEDIVDAATGEVRFDLNTDLTDQVLTKLRALGITRFKVFHIDKAHADNTIRDTLVLDRTASVEEALLAIYKRLRPGDPSTPATTRALFENLLFNPKRYDLSKIGRLKLNGKLGLDFDLEQRVLTKEDLIAVVRYLIGLKNGFGSIDDIDHLGNRRVRSVGELLENQFRLGLTRMERAIKERMSVQDLKTSMPHDLINSKPVTAAVKEFFGSSQLSQFMDQTNPLSEITHKRRLSALGPGGLTRERAGFEVRDVHPTHYGRICPIETPEGPNIGLIASLSSYARINTFGFIEVPYRKVVNGRVTKDIIFLAAAEEENAAIAQANAPVDAKGHFINDLVSARRGGDFVLIAPQQVDYIDVSPKQLVSVATSLIPFLEHDDANRALMGSNMQRQAVPLLRTEAPLVGTGMEFIAARDSGAVVLARRAGEVVSVDATRIVLRVHEDAASPEPNVEIFSLTKYQRSNQNTCITQKPIVREREQVQAGQVIADGMSTDHGELALGCNVLAAFMSWSGYNFEDSIIVSEKLVREDVFTSIHIEEFEVEARDTKQGKEEITRDIPNLGEDALRDLDESGIIRLGARVKAGDILVGKVTPKGETQLSPEEKLLKAIFGEKAGDVRDTSLTVPPGVEGTVIDVKVFSRKGIEKDSRALSIEEEEVEKVEKDFDDEIRIVREEHENRLRRLLLNKTCAQRLTGARGGSPLVAKGKKLTAEVLASLGLADLARVKVEDEVLNQQIMEIDDAAKDQIHLLASMRDEKVSKLRKGDELPPGVIKLVKVYVAIKRKLQVGDKMAGRHGNKGVVSKIVPEEDMPHLGDGTPIEIILNPLGVPSRMNVGQILETSLGWAAKQLGVYYSSPVFDGATEEDIRKQLEAANLPVSGRACLYDGRTGQTFDQEVLVGQIYMMKLHHLVDDKIHARSTGPYSLVTQQPLGGKAQFGGQRLGEMEVWALEAYGAAYTLQEMLTVKSDDVSGRTRMYEAIVKGTNSLEPSLPESFNVLVKELQSLALDVELLETAPGNGADGFAGGNGESSGDEDE